CLLAALDARAQVPVPAPPAPDGVERLLTQLQSIMLSGDIVGYLDLVSGSANRRKATDFGQMELQPGATRAVIKERERIPFGSSLTAAGYRVVADVFVEYGDIGRVATWQLDLQRFDDRFEIFDQQRLTSVERLFRLSLDADRQFAAQNLAIHA